MRRGTIRHQSLACQRRNLHQYLVRSWGRAMATDQGLIATKCCHPLLLHSEQNCSLWNQPCWDLKRFFVVFFFLSQSMMYISLVETLSLLHSEQNCSPWNQPCWDQKRFFVVVFFFLNQSMMYIQLVQTLSLLHSDQNCSLWNQPCWNKKHFSAVFSSFSTRVNQ